MLCRNHHKCNSKNCVWTRCKNWPFIPIYFKINFCSMTFPNPISLHCFCPRRPIQIVQLFQKFICIICSFQKPLLQRFNFNFCLASFTKSCLRLLIRQNSFTTRAPINTRFFLISQTFLKHFQKNPLIPFIIIWRRSINQPRPIITQPEKFLLFHKILHRFFSVFSWRNIIFNCSIFRRQT